MLIKVTKKILIVFTPLVLCESRNNSQKLFPNPAYAGLNLLTPMSQWLLSHVTLPVLIWEHKECQDISYWRTGTKWKATEKLLLSSYDRSFGLYGTIKKLKRINDILSTNIISMANQNGSTETFTWFYSTTVQ